MSLDYPHLFEHYKKLVSEADRAFEQVRKMHGDCVKCTIECCDCCYAFFGLYLIEAVYLNYQFNSLLARKQRRDITKTAAK